MQSFEDIDLFDCPLCHGPGLIEEENGWCLYVQCLDCGCHTAALTYDNEEERQTAGHPHRRRRLNWGAHFTPCKRNAASE